MPAINRAKGWMLDLMLWLEQQTCDWSLNRKVIGALSIFGAFGALAIVMVFVGLLKTATAAEQARTMIESEARVGNAETAVRAAEDRIKNFVIDPSAENKRLAQEDISTAQDALTNIRVNSSGTSVSQAVETLSRLLSDFRELFAVIVEKQETIDAHWTALLEPLGPKIGEELSDMNESSYRTGNYLASFRTGVSLNHYSQARIAVQNYRTSGDQGQMRLAKNSLLDLEDSMNAVFSAAEGAPTLTAQTNNVIADVVAYDGALDELAKLTDARNEATLRLVKDVGPAFDEEAGRIYETLAADFDRTVARGSRIYDALVTILVVMLVMGGLAMLLIALASTHLLSRPITELSALMCRLATGEQDVLVESPDRKDEIGEMTRAVVVFQRNAGEIEKQRAAADESRAREAAINQERAQERIAAREQAEAEKRKALVELANSFESSVRRVAAAVGSAAKEIKAGAQQVANAAETSAKVTAEVAATAQVSSENALAVANASDEMARSLAEVSYQVVESSDKSRSAAEVARSTDEIVAGLAEDASKIGEVVGLINDIAEQTNLLALNATIEAARAGDAGRGFAVVAGEIKALASQTSDATTQIAERVGGIQQVSRQAIEAIDRIAATIDEIDGIAATVAAAVEEQSMTTTEIATNTQQAASGSETVADNIERVRFGIGETGKAAQQSLSAAADLAAQAETLQAEVDAFLVRVRAA
ncbi:HAMP domain-containing protein [Pacificimonas sp. WHA3]|uniref:HAMP domain-containing protein n=1 Tax=Pacificimonas pallii TaxID=2827236 RepID=A0ABS6SF00_9SPHN|nr:HAMP domain-containing methyl-accepting chemotaxis protein [Pacificimonas pallii]MBV7256911.1 HAMP domain-containing protein [Pacificimonas pallii]